MPASRNRKQKRNADKRNATAGEDDAAVANTIPEDEQWRLIDATGILKQVPHLEHVETENQADSEAGDDTFSPLTEEIFNSILLIIPFTSLFVMMDILAHRQYARSLTPSQIMNSVVTNLPVLSLFIFYTTRYKSNPRMQALLFLMSVGAGTRIIYIVNTASWKVVLRQCPPLGTVWVYTIVQLQLLPAVVALGVVAAWVRVYGMKIIF